MKIGDFLMIETYGTDFLSIEKYRSKIIDKNSSYIYVDYPVHVKTKRTTGSFRIGTKVMAEYLGNDQSIYRFKTEIIDKRNGKIPTIALQLPNEDQIERIQRRQYVRVETAVDVAIHSNENSNEQKIKPFSTVTLDLSGGGLSIVVPKGFRLTDGDKLSIYLVLPMHSGHYHYLELYGEVVRFMEKESAATIASIKFLELNEQDKQFIIRYCFEKQREARQKELQ
ncbi:flagellar brake protein [Paucisalibacillus sp. EB02]|uniref:flagellar brake protein n=1 Tax=Paucisalibacillus sp. EB02 TaxID=1347087 RepID=UPI0004ADF746|nr:flagellar brake domain-containing protein [Paucisalibacillus sp. EB02]